MTISTKAITEEVKNTNHWVTAVQNELSRVIVGQRYLINRLIISLLANGHVLLEGVPGLATVSYTHLTLPTNREV